MIEAMVVNRLLKWQRWKFKTGVALGYPSQVTYYREPHIKSDTHFHDPRLDSDCLLTDNAVNLLPEVYKLLIRMEYIDPPTDERTRAHRYGKSRRTYVEDRSRAYLLIGNLVDTLIDSRQQDVA